MGGVGWESVKVRDVAMARDLLGAVSFVSSPLHVYRKERVGVSSVGVDDVVMS